MYIITLFVSESQQRKPINASSLISMLVICHYRQNAVSLKHFLNVLNALAYEISNLGFTLICWEFDNDKSLYKRFIEGLQYLKKSLELVKCNEILNSNQKLTDYSPNIVLKLRSYSIENLLQLAYYKNDALTPYILISMSGSI